MTPEPVLLFRRRQGAGLPRRPSRAADLALPHHRRPGRSRRASCYPAGRARTRTTWCVRKGRDAFRQAVLAQARPLVAELLWHARDGETGTFETPERRAEPRKDACGELVAADRATRRVRFHYQPGDCCERMQRFGLGRRTARLRRRGGKRGWKERWQPFRRSRQRVGLRIRPAGAVSESRDRRSARSSSADPWRAHAVATRRSCFWWRINHTHPMLDRGEFRRSRKTLPIWPTPNAGRSPAPHR